MPVGYRRRGDAKRPQSVQNFVEVDSDLEATSVYELIVFETSFFLDISPYYVQPQ